SVTFTATVVAVGPGGGTPSGTVTFAEGTTILGTGTLSSGTARFTTSSLGAGNHSIAAIYDGDTNDQGSISAALIQTVNRASTATGLPSSATPPVYRRAVTFTATVAAAIPGTGTPAGTVTFKDGATTLGTGTLISGQATLSISAADPAILS